MPTILPARLEAYRAATFRLSAAGRVTTVEEAVTFVNQRGFIYFWPIKDVVLPSLWVAVAGDRPVAAEHNDPGHVTWGWKDAMLGQRRWYYAKLLRRKATLVSLEVLPYFYALSENFGAPEDDYLLQYEAGRLTQEARQIYEALLREGPLHTVALRQAAHLSSRESDYRFSRALDELQAGLMILPVGVAEAGGWRYAFIYDIAARHYPQLAEQAHPIRESAARQKLVEITFRSVGAAQLRDLLRLFPWRASEAESAVQALVQAGRLVRGLSHPGAPGEWISVPDFL